jgi:hypothetical protein
VILIFARPDYGALGALKRRPLQTAENQPRELETVVERSGWDVVRRMPASAGRRAGTPAASPRPAAASGRGRIGGYDTIGLIVLIIAVAVIFIAGKVQEHYQKKLPARADGLLPGRRV